MIDPKIIYTGSPCTWHQELGGLRLRSDNHCYGCHREQQELNNERNKWDRARLGNRKTYFMGSKELGAVKIGHSENPEQRLGTVRQVTGDAELLFVLPYDIEREMHGRFAPFQILHPTGETEWFAEGPVLFFLEQVRTGESVVARESSLGI